MRLCQRALNGSHSLWSIRHEVVNLHLEISDVLYQARLDQMLEQVILAPLNIALHQVYRPYLTVGQNISRPHQSRGFTIRRPDLYMDELSLSTVIFTGLISWASPIWCTVILGLLEKRSGILRANSSRAQTRGF